MSEKTNNAGSTSKPFDAARQLDCGEVLDLLGVQRTRRKTHYRCPVCEGKALQLFKDGLTKCHACDKAMNAIDLVMHVTGLESGDACDYLANAFNLAPDDGRRTYMAPREQRFEKKEEAKPTSATERAIYAFLMGDGLMDDTRSYLESRAFTTEQIAAAGFVTLTEERWRAALKKYEPKSLARAGLIRIEDDGTYTPLLFAFPVMIMPYLEAAGDVSQIRYAIYGEARERDSNRKYLSGFGHVTQTLWGIDTLTLDGEVHITEGELNALALRQMGACALACCGSGTWLDAWCSVFSDDHHITLWQEVDEGGTMWAGRIVDSFALHRGDAWTAEHVRVKMCPPKSDLNDMLQSHALRDVMALDSWRDLSTLKPYALAKMWAGVMRECTFYEEGLYEALLRERATGWMAPHIEEAISDHGHHLAVMAWRGNTEHVFMRGLNPFGRLKALIQMAIPELKGAPND